MTLLHIRKKPSGNMKIALAFILSFLLASASFASADLMVGINHSPDPLAKGVVSSYDLSDRINAPSEVTVFVADNFIGKSDIMLAVSGQNLISPVIDGQLSQQIQNPGAPALIEGTNSHYYIWNLGNRSESISDWNFAFSYNDVKYYAKTVHLDGVMDGTRIRAFLDNDNDYYYSLGDVASGFDEQINISPHDGSTAAFEMIINDESELIVRKTSDGDFEEDGVITSMPPYLEVDGIQIEPVADDHHDLLLTVCEGTQTWTLLKEFTNWNDVNILGYYTDPGRGNDRVTIFEGPRNEGYTFNTNISDGEPLGLWLLNDTNGDSVYNGNDSWLFSERFLTRSSFANEHQWFMVYDVSSYKGTGATYEFVCPTEDFINSGDFDYLVYIDDDHTSANWDHNDMIFGISCSIDPDSCGNFPPGAPPTYFMVDTTNFMGVPTLPLPPPDSGGVYVYYDTTNCFWTIASHIYSKGNSLEQFHGSIISIMNETPELGVNVFISDFELWEDTTSNRCLFQNDRWGWALWDSTIGLYEIWWDVTTKEYRHGEGDVNDFLTVDLKGAAVDFNVWSNGHCGYFDASQVYLGENMIRLSDIPGYTDFGGFDVIDQYQAAVGSDPTNDPNTSAFSPHCGLGESYNVFGQIDEFDSYVCDSDYGLNFHGAKVYQADGIQFSTWGAYCDDPCEDNNPPICDLVDDATFFVCDDTTFSFYTTAFDPDENLLGCTMLSGPGSYVNEYWTFTTTGPGVYSATFECEDACGETCTGTVNITVNYNSPPEVSCPVVEPIFACDSSQICIPGFTYSDVDDNVSSVAVYGCELHGDTVCFYPEGPSKTILFVVTDECGATDSCSTVIDISYNSPPTATCPGDTTISICDETEICLPGFIASDVDHNIASIDIIGCEIHEDTVCFTPEGPSKTITMIVTDECGEADTCVTVVTIELNAPPDITCPADVTVECDSPTDPSNTGYATATDDNDPSPDISYFDTEIPGVCDQEKTIERTWIAVDDCNDSSTCLQIINVEDTTPPVFDQACPDDIAVECDDIPAAQTLTATDNCDPAPVVSLSEDTTPGSCDQEYILTRTWTATDDCDNSAVCVQVITVIDTTPPTFNQTCPADVTVECDDVPLAPLLSATDNCDPAPTVTFDESTTPGSCDQSYILTRTWTATDDCDNSDVCVQVVTVMDTTPPTFDQACPADVAVECDNIPSAATLTATDNCDPAPVVTYNETTTPGSCDQSYTLTRTWNATDDCGNSDVCVQVITVMDTTPPTFVQACPDDVTVECDNVPLAPLLSATDNCDPAPVVNFNETTTSGSCYQSYTLTRTWTATDACGNSDVCEQVITVMDTTPPTFNEACLADVTVECDNIPSAPTMTASDNCDPAPVVTFDETTTPNGCDQSYVLTRTWTATDDCGNSAQCVQTITVDDTTPPTFDQTCPADVTVECDNVPLAPLLSATDNCDPAPIVTFDETTTPNGCDQSYVLIRTWTATDDCGNSAQCVQTITVDDTTPPTFDQACPTDVTVECDAIPAAPILTASDNCDLSPTVSFDETTTPGGCPQEYVLTRTWTATDDCGNSAQCVQTITVDDTTPPQFAQACPANVTVECDNIPPEPTMTATDNCDPAPTVSFDESTTTGSCPQEYVITRTWTATDACGNSDVCVQVITVEDTTPPVFDSGCPTNTTVECDAVPTAPTLTATDNCDPAPVVSFDESAVPGNCPQEYVITRTWTATDACDNSAECVQVITVEDTTPPEFEQNCPPSVTVECDNIPPALTLTATDNCDQAPVVDFDEVITPGGCPQEYVITRTWTATDACDNSAECVQVVTVDDSTPPVFDQACPTNTTVECDNIPSAPTLTATDNCDPDPGVSFDETTTSGNCDQAYTLTRTWTATDACGNSDVCEQVITVEDTTPPVFDQACPADVAVECDNVPAAPTLTATDNCDPAPTVSLDEETTPGSCDQQYTLTRTWTATDACGNSAECVQVITVDDTTAPTFDQDCPAGATVECDNIPAAPELTATDNCDPAPVVTLDEDIAPDGCDQHYVLTRTWTATDDCGNSVDCVQVITVDDTTPPTITCPDDVIVECNDDVPPADILSVEADDACDPAPLVEHVSDVSDGLTCPETITRTYRATDDCDNSVTCVQLITVDDTTPPTITCPGDIIVECSGPTDPDNTGYPTASDNCDQNPQLAYTDQVDDSLITRTWTATDACDNVSESCQQIITLHENSPPEAECPSYDPIMVGDLAEPLCLSGFFASDVDDNIDSVYVNNGTVSGDTVCFIPVEGPNTICLYVVDECGETDTCCTIVEVIENTCPVITRPADTTVTCTYENFCDTVEVFDEDGDYIVMETDYGEFIPIVDEPGHWLGLYCFRVWDYDCGLHNNYQVTVSADDGLCIYDVSIAYDITVLGYVDLTMDEDVVVIPGAIGRVGLYLNTYECMCVGGINASIAWDASILTMVDMFPTENLDFGNEYHNINIDAFGPGSVKISYIADLNNQIPHGPLCEIDPNEPIFYMDFQVAPGTYPIDFVIPICFTSEESINDNAVADSSGYHVWWNEGCGDQPDSSQYGTLLLNLECGSIRIVDECDLLVGDINFNRLAFEIGDAVLLANHLMDPIEFPFTDMQMWASDVNGDSIRASIADLILLINVINGFGPASKVVPPDTPVEFVMAKNSSGETILRLDSEYDVGGLVIELPLGGGIETNMIIGPDQGMEIEVVEKTDRLRLFIYSPESNRIAAGSTEIMSFMLPEGMEITPTEVEVADARGGLADAIVSHELPLPERFGIANCYPNPFNAATTIDFTLPEPDRISLSLYDVTGRLVKTLVTDDLSAGYHQATWHGLNDAGQPVSSGVYFAKLKSQNDNLSISIEKLVLLK
ncbi:MAG: T9SS type A sorting domain-containing protein [candidate division Zixibacteria bacterium]|nr:T9SS type A sorting domain-containing protein [candidate division Zixibacteria bacterium]